MELRFVISDDFHLSMKQTTLSAGSKKLQVERDLEVRGEGLVKRGSQPERSER